MTRTTEAYVRCPVRERTRLFAILSGVLCLVFGSLIAMPSPSFAAQNDGIKVSGELSSEEGGQATIGDVLTFTGAWDATDANPQPGDTFTVGLPPELGFQAQIPLELRDADGTSWGSCLTNSPSDGIMTCSLSDAVEGKEEVKGTFELQVEAKQATSEETVKFDLNGETIEVDLPGEGGIDDGVIIQDEWSKSGALNGNKWSMTWSIELPGSRLAGNETVTILEDLSDNHQLCDPANLKVVSERGGDKQDVSAIASTQTEGVADPHDFKITLMEPEGGWDTNVLYRVTYQTCTPDKQIDPEGTEYTNEAYVDIFGESSGVIGLTQDWDFSDAVNKWGWVSDGANRNGVINWTVDVAGDLLHNKDGFNFTDALSGEHALCKDESGAYTVKGLKVAERYGPSDDLVGVLSEEQLARAVTPAEDGKSFSVEFATGSDFAFKGNSYIYRITYQTCATTDGLPTSGTAFSNEASVDGKIQASTTEVPNRTERKTGSINSNMVTLDDVDYLPQTTLNWGITVPGERLTDPVQIASPVTVTDKSSENLTVCGEGENLKSRLGLKVEARDQINNGGLPAVDLTDATTASLEDGALTFEIAAPDLPLPGDGEATSKGWSKEYQYVISYTTCTASGGMDAPGATYGNEATVAGKTYKQSVTQEYRGSGTGQGVSRGSVEISKALTDNAGAEFVPEGTNFTVHAQEIDPEGNVQLEYDLEVPLNGDPVKGLNARGNGWTIKLSEPSFPNVPGVTFGDPTFSDSEGVTPSEDGTTAVATLTPGSNVQVELDNTAQLGSIQIDKKVDGPAGGLSDVDSFPITAKIDTSALGDNFPAQEDRTLELTPGEPLTLDDLPIGSVVSFSENLPETNDLITWGTPEFSPEQVEVTADHVAAPVLVTVTNTANRTLGTFSLAKNVTGDQAKNTAVPDEVEVTATWEQEGESHSKVLNLPTDGSAVEFGEDLYVGTEVTLVETPLADGSSIAWGTPAWSGPGVELDEDGSAVVTVTRGSEALVSVENHAATSTAGLSVLKVVGGEAAEAVGSDTEFTVLVEWEDADGTAQSKELAINAAEPAILGEDLPAGTVLTLSELTAPEAVGVNWGNVRFSGTGVEAGENGTATVVVSDQHDAVTLVTVTNEAHWKPGTFELSKTITGVDTSGSDVPKSVDVTAAWIVDGEQNSKDFTIPTDGTPVAFGEELPYMTDVVLTEAAPEASAALTWATPAWSGDGLTENGDGTATLTIGAGTTASVELVNKAQPVNTVPSDDASTAPSEQPSAGSNLPFTGAQGVLVIAGIAAVLLLAGTAIVLLRRRGNAS